MINFTAPYSLEDCVSRLETTQQVGTALSLHTKVEISHTTAASTGFRFELWLASLRLGFAQGSMAREAESVTRVRGIAFANNLIQMGVVLLVAVGLLLTWQRAGGNQRDFVPFAIVFVLIGPGLSLLVRSQVEAALRRALS